MTPERLAKVAEVLHHEGWPVEPGWKLTPDTCGTCATALRLAQALAPLLDEFQAEDEARIKRAEEDANRAIDRRREETVRAKAAETKAVRVREAVEAVLAEGPNTWTPYDSRDTGETFLADSVLDWLGDLRAALDAAEKENHDG